MKKKIKLGILLNSYLVPFWSYKMIEEINNSSYAEINLIVKNDSKNYGYGMRVNQVLKLSETDYEEKIVSSIYPNWDKKLFATHTLTSCENLTVIDGCFKRKRYF